MITRVGQGYDVHRLAAGRRLVLAGVQIASDEGLVGHSDADVVLHAVMDAMLGAAGLGDIGEYFSDRDPAYRDIDSGELLKNVRRMVEAAGFEVVNADVTVIAERPKLTDYKQQMRERLAGMLGIGQGAAGIKAKTNEGLGDIGSGKAIACQAVVSLTDRKISMG